MPEFKVTYIQSNAEASISDLIAADASLITVEHDGHRSYIIRPDKWPHLAFGLPTDTDLDQFASAYMECEGDANTAKLFTKWHNQQV